MDFPHPNNMTAWPEIACQRGHASHATRMVNVDLGTPHGFADLPAVPQRLARAWPMHVYDPARYPVDGGPYCPAHDAVSATIASEGIWEPAETIVASHVLSSARPEGPTVLDIGCQIGWFSLLALHWGAGVLAIDADQENLRLLQASAAASRWHPRLSTYQQRLAPGAALACDAELRGARIRLAKIDIEGAEPEALAALDPWLRGGLISHLLVEVSPVLRPGSAYADALARLQGYEAFRLPDKRRPPARLEDPARDLALIPPDELAELAQRAGHQENIWLKHKEASW